MRVNYRAGEVWVNGWGIFYSGLYGVETPHGTGFYYRSPIMRLRHHRLRKTAQLRYSEV